MPTGVVIFGPRTRLGTAVLEALDVPPSQRFLVARDQPEWTRLASKWPGSTVVRGWEAHRTWPGRYDRMAVYGCALGPVHPDEPLWSEDVRSAVRDLEIVERLLRTCAPIPVHVVFVSSVLALVRPRAGRAYYSGWKRLIEGRLEAMVRHVASASLSVVYPGRLVNSQSPSRPLSFLHTTYRRLARILIRIAEANETSRALVGLDARLLVLLRAVGSLPTTLR